MKWVDAADGSLPMHLADMDLKTAPEVTRALADRANHGVFGYTAIGPRFFEAVTNWVASRRHWAIEDEWITACTGVMPSMAHFLRATFDPGMGVIVQTPAFSPIVDVVEHNALTVFENPLILQDGRYQMDFDSLETTASRPDVQAFVLCSPHNPAGRVWTLSELERVAEICAVHDILVISDEIHAEIIYPWARFETYAIAAERTARYVTLFGPSKGFNLAALRTSLAVIPDDILRAQFRLELQRVNEDFGLGAMGAVALEAAYGEGADWLDSLAAHLETNLEALTSGLDALDGVTVIRPDASFLVWVDCRGMGLSDEELADRIITRAGVTVEPGINFGKNGSGFVRINIGTTRDIVDEAVTRHRRRSGDLIGSRLRATAAPALVTLS